jgi:uncharacterized membrane protein
LESDNFAGKGNSNDEKYESVLRTANGLILRYGVILSSVLIILGIADVFINPAAAGLPHSIAAIVNSGFGSPNMNGVSVMTGAARLNGLDIIEIGVVILLGTPIFRVAVTTVIFAAERDGTYLLISLFVLFVLLVSVFIVGPFEAAGKI